MPHSFPTVSNHNVNFKTAIQAAQNAVSKASVGTLKDVSANGAGQNYALLFNATTEKWEAKSLTGIPDSIPQTLEDLNDVSTTDPTDGQVLKYINATGFWTPSAVGALTAALNDLTDVDTATIPAYIGANLLFDGTDWVTSPADNITIWVAASANGGDNTNSGLATGEALADVQTALQRVLQRGSVVGSNIKVKGLDVPWSTVTNNLINVNLSNGPSFKQFIMTGDSQAFATLVGGVPTRTTGAALTDYAITPQVGKTVSNGWNCTLFPNALKWAEVVVGGASRVIPVLVDDQSDNNRARVYMAYWDQTGTGFASTPVLTDRSLVDSTTITNSASFYGPMSLTNFILKGPDAGELKFLNGVSMQYMEVSSTTGGVTTHVVFDGTAQYCRFTDLTIDCKGSLLYTTDYAEKCTFVNCIFYNCAFTQAQNVSFVGCIFYKNPTLFKNAHANIHLDICTFIYTTSTDIGLLLSQTAGGNAVFKNCVVDLKAFASGTAPIGLGCPFTTDRSTLTLRSITVPDGVLCDTITGDDPPNPYTICHGFCWIFDQSKVVISQCKITDTSTGDAPLLVIDNQGVLLLNDSDISVNVRPLIAAAGNSNLLLTNLNDQIKCGGFIYGIYSSIALENITIKTGGANVISEYFLRVNNCTVRGLGNSDTTGIYVDNNHTNTKSLITAKDSNIELQLIPDGVVMDMYGTINLTNTKCILNVINNTQKAKINLINGTGIDNSVVKTTDSNLTMTDISLQNNHTSGSNSRCLDVFGSTIKVYYTVFDVASENVINNISSNSIKIETKSDVLIRGKIGSIKSIDDNDPVIDCNNHSKLVIQSNITNAEAVTYHTVIQRDSNNPAGSVSVISILDNSLVTIENINVSERQNPEPATINIHLGAPELLLKGQSGNTSGGFSPVSVMANSILFVSYTKVIFNKINYGWRILQGSICTLQGCDISDTSGDATRLNYFHVEDSEFNIVGDSVSDANGYNPKMIVQAADSASQGVIIASNSKVLFSIMGIQSLDAVGTEQTIIRANNDSRARYNKPRQYANNGFATGLQLRSNSRGTFLTNGTNDVTCTQDILCGILTGANDGERKLDNMAGGAIIPVHIVGYTNYKGFIDAAEGCLATLAV